MALTAQMSPCLIDMRKAARACVSLDATMRQLGDSGVRAEVLNISTDGFMVETEGRFSTGSYIWVKLPALAPISAKVIWSRGGRVGGRFTAPLAQDDFRNLGVASEG